jgi:hypothetical protein
MYGGLGVTFFLLVLFLQEVAGYSALRAGLALIPVTVVTFAPVQLGRHRRPARPDRDPQPPP